MIHVPAPGAMIHVPAPGAMIYIPAPGEMIHVPSLEAMIHVPGPGWALSEVQAGAYVWNQKSIIPGMVLGP